RPGLDGAGLHHLRHGHVRRPRLLAGPGIDVGQGAVGGPQVNADDIARSHGLLPEEEYHHKGTKGTKKTIEGEDTARRRCLPLILPDPELSFFSVSFVPLW